MNSLEKQKTLRDLYLKRLYEMSDGNALRYFAASEIGRELGWDDDTSDKVTAYLKSEGLVDFPAVGRVGITHKGVKRIGKTLSRSRRVTRTASQRGFITLMAEGDITVGGDVIGRDKKTKKSK
jgi:Mn-dependent DtxR family transcriptional regulator